MKPRPNLSKRTHFTLHEIGLVIDVVKMMFVFSCVVVKLTWIFGIVSMGYKLVANAHGKFSLTFHRIKFVGEFIQRTSVIDDLVLFFFILAWGALQYINDAIKTSIMSKINSNKCSATAEISDCLATIDISRKLPGWLLANDLLILPEQPCSLEGWIAKLKGSVQEQHNRD